ncbi:hypothetical protein ABZZ80_01465 [Streptomyces sp. NPDC006356]
MTTPRPTPPPPPPPPPQQPYPARPPTAPVAGFPPPPPPGRPRRRRGLVASVVTVLVLLLASGGFVVWKTVYGDGGGPLAGRPRVTDRAAGISYGIPEGWKRKEGDLISAFTSVINEEHADAKESGSVVFAGKGEGVTEGGLGAYTERWARSNGEFFFPYGSTSKEESRAITVDGRLAHTVVLNVTDSEAGPGRLRMTLIAVDGSRVAFLIGITSRPDETAGQETGLETVDAVLRSATLLS